MYIPFFHTCIESLKYIILSSLHIGKIHFYTHPDVRLTSTLGTSGQVPDILAPVKLVSNIWQLFRYHVPNIKRDTFLPGGSLGTFFPPFNATDLRGKTTVRSSSFWRFWLLWVP